MNHQMNIPKALRQHILAILADYKTHVLARYPRFLSSYERDYHIFEKFQTLLADTTAPTSISSSLPGHITVSAWVIDDSLQRFLLCYHKKIAKWIPLGGHFEPSLDQSLFAGALREVSEESGIAQKHLMGLKEGGDILPFDMDIHTIAAHQHQEEHFHYDVGFVLIAKDINLQPSEELHDVRWVAGKDIRSLTSEYATIRQKLKIEWLLSQAGTLKPS
ncbi:MAG: NUDIX domain-containing protein [Proteobacteria bacterium]|nr:NUDIX domain-containing protein [Pseudomonadota bacterium]